LDEAVVLNPDSNAYVRLNATGRWVWDRLEGPQTIDSLGRMFAAEFELDGEWALAEVRAFVDGLLQRDLVDVS
jgi:Coenzyme PQQ synthesis protein D (PqqD)